MIYKMKENSFNIMNIFTIDMAQASNPFVVNTNGSEECFFPNIEKTRFNEVLKSILEMDFETGNQIAFIRG